VLLIWGWAQLETENGRLKKLLAEQVLENEVIKDALRKKW
jgi:putative transposase